jgi:hypothetical protein
MRDFFMNAPVKVGGKRAGNPKPTDSRDAGALPDMPTDPEPRL